MGKNLKKAITLFILSTTMAFGLIVWLYSINGGDDKLVLDEKTKKVLNTHLNRLRLEYQCFKVFKVLSKTDDEMKIAISDFKDQIQLKENTILDNVIIETLRVDIIDTYFDTILGNLRLEIRSTKDDKQFIKKNIPIFIKEENFQYLCNTFFRPLI